MSLPTNNEIFEAIAKILDCRDHKRGRKPSLLVTIITGEDGKTIVTDHNTGCTTAIGKRSYKRRSFIHRQMAKLPEKRKREVTKQTELSDEDQRTTSIAEAKVLFTQIKNQIVGMEASPIKSNLERKLTVVGNLLKSMGVDISAM